MGGTGFSFKLPRPPTPEELQAWNDWVAECQGRIDAYLKEHAPVEGDTSDVAVLTASVRKRLQQLPQPERPSYESSPFSAEADIPKFFKIRCDNEFQSKGFPRVTVEHEKASKWNAATADILADQWKFWYWRHQLLSARKVPNIDARGIIGRWMEYVSTDPTRPYRVNTDIPEILDLMEKARSDAAKEHFKKRTAVARVRLEALETISLHKSCTVLPKVLCPDAMSDYESDSEDRSGPPTRIVPFWRSDKLSALMRLLDLASFQQADPARKKKLSALLVRKGIREANEDEATAQKVPQELPQEAYSDEFLSDLSSLERHHLGIFVPSTAEASITEATTALQELTERRGPVPPSSRSMRASDVSLSRKKRKTLTSIDV